MDERRFDDLARSLAGAATRRGLLRAMVGGALGVALARVGGRTARGAPVCRPDGEPCNEAGDCCSLYCRTRREPGVPRRRRCVCRPDGLGCNDPSQCCSGRCVNRTCGGPPPGTCRGNLCAGTGRGCDREAECDCARRLEGGPVCVSGPAPGPFRVGPTGFPDCGQCATDAECRTIFEREDVVCIRFSGGECPCPADQPGTCFLICGGRNP